MNHHDTLKVAKQKHDDSLRWDEKIGVFITNCVGTMLCALIFSIIAVTGLKEALGPDGIGIVNWFVEEFCQFVLLSVIIVGQNVESRKGEQLMLKVYEDSELLKRLIMDNTDLTKEIHALLGRKKLSTGTRNKVQKR